MNPVAIDNSPAQYDTDTTVDVINIKSLRGPKKIFWGFQILFGMSGNSKVPLT